jgi:putative ABC transport system ATP-binding protein
VTLLLEGRNLAFAFRDGDAQTPVLRDVSLSVQPGEFVGLMGPSGSGKSSLLFLLAGLRTPARGEVRVLGAPWPGDAGARADQRRRSLGLILQEPFLLTHLSVRENASAHAIDDDAAARIPGLAESLGIAQRLDAFPHQLSVGERQRASVLRALVNSPALVLADEPTAHLDHAAGRQVIELLVRGARAAGLLVATHDPEMLAAADRVLRLSDGRLAETVAGA